jgi:basic amino acid/polyamine antiporter, APA family
MGLFTRKPIAALRAEAEGGTLKRSLGPLNLTALGIGSIIGTGIFVLTGTAASQNAGPALVLSMIISAVGCAFSGLCYAEFAAMVPVAGSAYTYAYATVGELVAWIIGWDLILEYALSTATVAVGWSGYFVSLLKDVGIVVPPWMAAPPFNLPAVAIVIVVAALLVIGIKESADTNTVLVAIKAAVLVVFVVAGASYVKRANLTPFIPPNTGVFGEFGWSGVLRGAGVMFFAYIGFDAVSTAAQEARNPARDMPIGILGSLIICTVLYILVAIVLIGIVPYRQLMVADPLAVGIDATGLSWLSPVIKSAALFGLFSTMLVTLLGQTRIFFTMSRDGLLPAAFGRVHPRFRTPHLSTILTDHRGSGRVDADRRPQPAGQYRNAVRVRARQPGRDHSAATGARARAAVPDAMGAICSDRRRTDVLCANGWAACRHLGTPFCVARGRSFVLFRIWTSSSRPTVRATCRRITGLIV